MTRTAKRPDPLTDAMVDDIRARLAAGKRVRRTLPGWGRIHVDRPLPFLCVYRKPPHTSDRGTERLVVAEAAYLTASGAPARRAGLRRLLHSVAREMVRQFGSFLVLELWSAADAAESSSGQHVPPPCFRLVTPSWRPLDALTLVLESALSEVRIDRRAPTVEVSEARQCSPPGMPPILSGADAKRLGCHVLGLEAAPVYRQSADGELYPLVLRKLRRQLTRRLRRVFFEFARQYTSHRPAHFHMLGRRAVVKAVWDVDRRLADIADSFDYLLQVTPTNVDRALRRFLASKAERAPVLRYRPLPVDPALLKRKLFAVPIERVEDPALAHLFRQKQDELDRQITLLHDIGTPRFVHVSQQLFGGVSDAELDIAEQLLTAIPAKSREARAKAVDAEAFAKAARREIARYRRRWPAFAATVQLRDDLPAGLLASRGHLLVGRRFRASGSRVEALLDHEIGVHLITYYNGRAQPFRQLSAGLAGYEPLQEGLAVLAEYLCGGLTRRRLRLLAARTLAVRRLLAGATFVDTFRELHAVRGLDRRNAFMVAMRVHRGGGLTKDAVYLRGLTSVLDYLAGGGTLPPLFVGKIGCDDIPVVRELQWRGVLRDAPLTPRGLARPGVGRTLQRLARGLSVMDLLERD